MNFKWLNIITKGVDLNKFVIELKSYYIYSKDQKVCKMIEGLSVDGNDKYFQWLKYTITVDGRKMITIMKRI
jgi:hypothetical protein